MTHETDISLYIPQKNKKIKYLHTILFLQISISSVGQSNESPLSGGGVRGGAGGSSLPAKCNEITTPQPFVDGDTLFAKIERLIKPMGTTRPISLAV